MAKWNKIKKKNFRSFKKKTTCYIAGKNLQWPVSLHVAVRDGVFLHNWLCGKSLRADVSKYRPEVCKSEKSKILKKIHKVALGKLIT